MHKRPRLVEEETMEDVKDDSVKDPKSSFQVLMERTMDFTLTHSETKEQCNFSDLLRDVFVMLNQLNRKCDELASRKHDK